MNTRMLLVALATVLFIFVSEAMPEEWARETKFRPEIRTNVIFRFLFSLFYSDSEALFFKEKAKHENGISVREFELSNKKRLLAKLFSNNGEYGGFAKFGDSSDMAGDFRAEQVKILFEVYDFAMRAERGDRYSNIYETASNSYNFEIRAIREDRIRIALNDDELVATFFKGLIWKNGNHFASLHFWVTKGENNARGVLKCLLSVRFWPDILLRTDDNL